MTAAGAKKKTPGNILSHKTTKMQATSHENILNGPKYMDFPWPQPFII